MGYADTLPYSEILIKTPLKDVLTIKEVVADYVVGSLTIPTFTHPLHYAYLDMVIQGAIDDSGVPVYNWFNTGSGSYGLKDTGGTYRIAQDIDQGYCNVKASSRWDSHYVITGTVNIAQYITSGATQEVRFHDVRAANDNLYLLASYGELRLYFGLR